MSRTSSAVVLVLAALVLSGSPPAGADEGKVHVTVVAVRALPAADGVTPGVGPGLDKVASKLQRLPFARFESDSTTERSMAAGERLTIPFAGAGRFVVSARPAEGGGFELEIQEFAPMADTPCLSQKARVQDGRTHVTFCDGVPDPAATMVFLATVGPAR